MSKPRKKTRLGACLRHHLVLEPCWWADVYGWQCCGHDSTGEKEWKRAASFRPPLVSPNTELTFEWLPRSQKRREIGAETGLEAALQELVQALKRRPNEWGTYIEAPHIWVMIPILLRTMRRPLEVLERLQLPAYAHAELSVWLRVLLSDAPSEEGTWVEMSVDERLL